MATIAPADAELIRRCRRGDERAFDALVLRHRERAMALARQLVGSHEAAEDLVQEAFLRAARALPALHDEAKFAPWLQVIVRRLAVRRRTMQPGVNGRPQVVSLEAAEALVDVPAPEEDEAQAELRERVRTSLSQLTQQNREVLTQFYLEGLTHVEIATRTGLPVGTVKRRLHDSKQRFRMEWQKMTRAAQAEQTARKLQVWYCGEAGAAGVALMGRLLPQNIALAICKRGRTPEQIAVRVDAHPSYVQDVLDEMVHFELASVQRGRYLLNFIVLEREDQYELRCHAEALGKQMAEYLAPDVPRLQACYEETGLPGRGHPWADLQWAGVHLFLCTWGPLLEAPEVSNLEVMQHLPLQPDGKHYYLGATEVGGDLLPRLPGCRVRAWREGGTAFIRWPEVEKTYLECPEGTALRVVTALAGGGKTARQLETRVDGEKYEVSDALIRLIESGHVTRRGPRLALTFAVFLPEEMDALLSLARQLVRPVARDLLVPEAQRFDSLVEKLGYGRLREQIPATRGVLAMQNVKAWTMHALARAGALPPPPERAPATWGFFGWRNGEEAIIHGTG